jgi:hypothetical protein
MFILGQVRHNMFSKNRVGKIKIIEVEFKLVSNGRIED